MISLGAVWHNHKIDHHFRWFWIDDGKGPRKVWGRVVPEGNSWDGCTGYHFAIRCPEPNTHDSTETLDDYKILRISLAERDDDGKPCELPEMV